MSDPYTSHGRMKVIDPLGQAINWTSITLIPFKFGTWLRFGFIAFLAAISSGGGGGGSTNIPAGGFPGNVPRELDTIRDGIVENLVVILIVAGILITIGIAITLLLTWLSSRGHMMMIRAVVMRNPLIGENWTATGRLANSLWLFRIAMYIVTFALTLPLLAYGAVVTFSLGELTDETVLAALLSLIPAIFGIVFIVLSMAVVDFTLSTLVVPLMYMFDLTCVDAWRKLRQVSKGNMLPIVIILHVRGFYYLVFGFATIVIGFLTCCVGFLPIIHHTLFAPFYVFDRAYCIYIYETLGPEYQVFLRDEDMTAPVDEELMP